MSNYDLEYLKDKGFFKEKVELDDDYSPGETIEYIFDPENKLAYFENNFKREEISKIVKGLKNREILITTGFGKMVELLCSGRLEKTSNSFTTFLIL